jgi:PAS domain S-box-containing protein
MPERIRILHDVTAAMLRILDLERLLPEIARSATALESADASSVMLADESGEVLRIVAQNGLSDEYAAVQRVPIARAREMYQGFDTPVDIDLRTDPPGDPALIARERLARVVAMPLVHEGRLIGAINVYSRDATRRFDAVDVEILHILAAQASVAITNARLYDEERSARRLQESVLESIGDGILIAFPDGRLRMNDAARRIFGYDEAPVAVEALRARFELIDPQGQPVADADGPIDRALRGQPTSGVFSTRERAAGGARVLRILAEPVRGPRDTVVAAVVSLHDVTAEREAERQKDEFLSIVSHELKTPLTPLKALAQLLRLRLRRHRDDGRPLDLDSLDTNLRTIERQVDRMSGLVNDLLEVSRAGQGRFELQPQEFDLCQVVRDVVQRHAELAAEDGRHRFDVRTPDGCVITGDAARLEQAIANLVGNAVKYSPSGGDVRVALVADGDGVTLSVADQGIGIAAEELADLGKPFARGSRRARTFSGMGIGLYLARLVAERHGGSLAIASPGEDQGTTVTVVLPRIPAS